MSKPWFEVYCSLDPSKLTKWSAGDDIRKEKWYHTIELPDGSRTVGVYDMSCSLDKCFLESITGKRVLDVGAADGFYTLEMCKRGALVTAIEAHPTLVRHIRYVTSAHGFSPQVLECDVFSDEFTQIQDRYDVVFCSHVICHIMECPAKNIGKAQFIERVKSKLSQKGHIIATTTPSDYAITVSRFKHHISQSYKLNQHGINDVMILKLWDHDEDT